ncbi:MAG: energy transducer TonB [Pseudomonadales bacterium]|nr:energy transducer TonB [Pseudomonadales bacterium]
MISGQQRLQNLSFRWGGSFLFVVAIYAVVVLAVLTKCTSDSAVSALPMAAIMVELAPMPVAPEAPPSTLPFVPEQVEMPPPPEPLLEPVPELEVEPDVAELPIFEEAAAVLTPKPEPIEEKPPEEVVEKVIEPQESAPPVVEAPPSDVAAAPMDGTLSLVNSQAKMTWQSVLLGHLEKHKRYPRQARRKGQEAIVYVQVTIDRDGTVLEHHLTTDCPYRALNRETLALISRAQPLPPPPAQLVGDTVEFVVPVSFSLRN